MKYETKPSSYNNNNSNNNNNNKNYSYNNNNSYSKPENSNSETDPNADRIICRVYINTSKTGENYLRLILENGDKLSAFKTKNSNDPNASDWEYFDKNIKQKILKIDKFVKDNGKEYLKIQINDKNGKFNVGFLANKVNVKKNERTPDYIAYSKTMTNANDKQG